MGTVQYREAGLFDAEAIADLHADSWRRHYRGAYSDEYLDGEVTEERRAVWAERLRQAGGDRFTIVAELEGRLAGFAHTRLDADPRWGALLENLHVANDVKRQGVGRALMVATAHELSQRRPGGGLYLWVLEQNTAAQAFYAAQGGRCVGRATRGPFPGGGTGPGFRYVWADPSVDLRQP